jgi:hypothetical protein
MAGVWLVPVAGQADGICRSPGSRRRTPCILSRGGGRRGWRMRVFNMVINAVMSLLSAWHASSVPRASDAGEGGG